MKGEIVTPSRILVLGAAYGLLPAMRLLTAGHNVTVICRPEEQSDLVDHGAQISFKASDQRLEAPAAMGRGTPGVLGVTDADVELSGTDLVILAMSEPHFAAPEISALIKKIGEAGLPVISISNAPPPPFLRRLNKLNTDALQEAYIAWDAWQYLKPEQVTAVSPDAQAVRKNPSRLNELTVTLGSNFKVAPFHRESDQALLERLARDVAAYEVDGRQVSVRFVPHRSLYAPLAKWPMLVTGNCRCLGSDGSMVSISDAVRSDLEASREVYEWVLELVQKTGADDSDLVPFRHYAAVSRRLIAPSSFARSVVARGGAVERVDKMVQLTGRALGMSHGDLDAIVTFADNHMLETSSTAH